MALFYQSNDMSSSTNLKNVKNIEVVALALKRQLDGRYLVVRRGPGQSGSGDWEFPGGKIEPNESQRQALVREIEEELGFLIVEDKLVYLAKNTHAYPEKTVQLFLWQLTLNEIPEITLTEHDKLCWCDSNEMMGLGLSQADIPFITKLE